MEFIKLSVTCYYFQSAVNIGYINHGNEGMLVDAGLDKSTMKKVLKKLDEEGLPITHLYITHAHADHFGGAAYLQQARNVFTIAPVLEEAILRNPILEPIYLFQGNTPLDELRNKFLEGEAITVDKVITEGTYKVDRFDFTAIAFPGHSENQLGILIDNLLYCGDAYFSEEQLRKHKIPYIVDAAQTLKSLEKLKSIECDGAVPGHGIFEQDFNGTVVRNFDYHLAVLTSVTELFWEAGESISHEEIVKLMCDKWNVQLTHLSGFLLYRTAVTAYVTKLVRDGMVTTHIENNTLMFKM
ncbi:MBL fold metallo-hydrolase [Bacillus luteolus]|uniref:MBL fold metallo-hydrolase n=1 Tax=Litchfieldia luteola TaxID=682179 RepID=A0ABR9QLS1_9BACI|nr:MBL fold metallo-hydrolase [Cytobacillus luteolus]